LPPDTLNGTLRVPVAKGNVTTAPEVFGMPLGFQFVATSHALVPVVGMNCWAQADEAEQAKVAPAATASAWTDFDFKIDRILCSSTKMK
jgi:hypothetical protein